MTSKKYNSGNDLRQIKSELPIFEQQGEDTQQGAWAKTNIQKIPLQSVQLTEPHPYKDDVGEGDIECSPFMSGTRTPGRCRITVSEVAAVNIDASLPRSLSIQDTSQAKALDFSEAKHLEEHEGPDLFSLQSLKDEAIDDLDNEEEAEKSAQAVKKVLQRKHWFAYLWATLFLASNTLTQVLDFINLRSMPLSRQISTVGMTFVMVVQIVLTLSFLKKQTQTLIVLIMIILQLKLFTRTFMISYSEYSDAPDISPELTLEQFQISKHLVLFFEQSILTFVTISSVRQRKAFMCLLFLEISALYMALYSRLPIKGETEATVARSKHVYLNIAYILGNGLFTFCMYNMENLSSYIIKMELEENLKYKTMFNTLQDAILLVKGKALTFKNSPATQLLKEAPLGQEMEHPLFFLFSQQNDSSSKQLLLPDKGACLTLHKLLKMDSRTIKHTVFTNSREVNGATQMDQVQKIIEDGKQAVRFFSIRVITVKRGQSDACSTEDEVMVQIQDISLRVQSEYLRVERQYMSIMNSTVSHEMRNPLNAIVAQTERQQKTMTKIEAIVQRQPLNEKDRGDWQSLIADVRTSLDVAKSSTNLIRFNVEDILALPQLKAGKFTKIVRDCEFKAGVQEIVGIMAEQAKAKQVGIREFYSGFPAQPDGRIVLPLDLRRFQQVLLNYLSNALKFTEAGGKVGLFFDYIPSAAGDSIIQHNRIEDLTRAAALVFYGNSAVLSPPVNQQASPHCFPSPDGSSPDGSPQSRQAGEIAFFDLQQAASAKMASMEDHPKLVISVLDTGLGISLANQMKLFKLFGCLESTRKVNTMGIGLGLSICKMISEEFGGGVAVHSKIGQGSIFQASFLLAPETVNLEQKSKEQEWLALQLQEIHTKQAALAELNYIRLAAREQLPAERAKVLVLDDEAFNTDVLELMITDLGLPRQRVDKVLSGEAALSKLKDRGSQCPYSVIFTDLSMPVMDGYQFAKEARKLLSAKGLSPSEQPLIIALTGHTESEFFTLALNSGINQIYSKPIKSDQICLILLQAGYRIDLEQARKVLQSQGV